MINYNYICVYITTQIIHLSHMSPGLSERCVESGYKEPYCLPPVFSQFSNPKPASFLKTP